MLKVFDASAPRASRLVAARHLRLAVAVAALLAGLVVFGQGAGAYYDNVALLTFLSIILALSLRLLMLAGEASLCHGGFYALGAYTVAILTANHGFSFWLALPLGGVVAAVGAVVIGVPSLRTSGAYFFLMTFGSLIVLTSILQYWTSLTGGFSGISAIRGPIGIGNVDNWFFLALGLLVVIVGLRNQWASTRSS
jgi:branched-chain amino acid transport system permease protein